MEVTYSKEELDFSAEVRDFVSDSLPGDVARKVLEHKRIFKEDVQRWHAALHEKGWIAPHWPKEHGGCAWNAVQRHIFDV